MFESENVNKKTQGSQKGCQRDRFENYSRWINLTREIETFGQLPTEKKKKKNRFLIKNNDTALEEVQKSKFAQINNKRYYFSEGIVYPSVFAQNCSI